jgi:uncharacterized protein YqeY
MTFIKKNLEPKDMLPLLKAKCFANQKKATGLTGLRRVNSFGNEENISKKLLLDDDSETSILKGSAKRLRERQESLRSFKNKLESS